jgi:hypothetical protein
MKTNILFKEFFRPENAMGGACLFSGGDRSPTTCFFANRRTALNPADPEPGSPDFTIGRPGLCVAI